MLSMNLASVVEKENFRAESLVIYRIKTSVCLVIASLISCYLTSPILFSRNHLWFLIRWISRMSNGTRPD